MGLFNRLRMTGTSSSEKDHQMYNDWIERKRKMEYPMLKNITYLDHGGTTLASKSLLRSFCKAMQCSLLANPHSDASNPSASSIIVAETRQKVLRFLKADSKHFDVVFTANATAAIKLVAECFSGHGSGFKYYYHRNCHTSLVGIREVAQESHYLASDEETEQWLSEGYDISHDLRPTLFAYPTQSNFNGQRLPLSWSGRVRNGGRQLEAYTLLDAAAYVSTSALDLSEHQSAPDFIALSFYKIFGFPDLGALIVRIASAHILDQRKYFGGGTTEMITALEEKPWVARKLGDIHSRLKDGTIAICSILALSCAVDTHQHIFGSMHAVSRHTQWLAKTLYQRLLILNHGSSVPVCHMYKALESTYGDSTTQGATLAMNIRKYDGSWMGAYEVGSILRTRDIHVRTGSLCNPAGMACALSLSPIDIRRAYAAGFRCNQRDDIRDDGRLFGVVRITFGAMNTLKDVDTIVRCFEDMAVQRDPRETKESWQLTKDSRGTSPSFPSQEDPRSYGHRTWHRKEKEELKSAWQSFWKSAGDCFSFEQRSN